METKASGSKELYNTGAQRDVRAGKGRFDLGFTLANLRLAGVDERGAAHYGDYNWTKGMPIMRFIDSMLRHAWQYVTGQTDEDHAGQMLWNSRAVVHIDEGIRRGIYPAELDDRPKFGANVKVSAPAKATAAEPQLEVESLPGDKLDSVAQWIEQDPHWGRRLRVYIAGPYSGATPEEVEANVQRAQKAALRVLARGHLPICPHAATHFMGGTGLPWLFWMAFDQLLQAMCDALLYLKSSRGANLELSRARDSEQKVLWSVEDLPMVPWPGGVTPKF